VSTTSTPIYSYGDPTVIPRLFAEHIINTAVSTTLSKVFLSNAISEVTVETQTAGPALLQLTIIDPDWSVIRSGIFNRDSNGLLQTIDINFPEGTTVWWRLAMVEPASISPSSNSPNFTISFQHRFIAQLMQCYGPLGWPSGKVGSTRAQFIRMLLSKLENELPAALRGPGFTLPTLICPAINEIQPVASSNIYGTEVTTEASAAARSAGINKTPGLTAASAITIEGKKPSTQQLTNINTILGVGTGLKASATALAGAIYAAIGESSITIVKSGDGGSQGVFQSGGGSLGNPYDAGQDLAAQAAGFFNGGPDFQGGGAIALANKGYPIWKIANAVEANQIYDTSGRDSYTTRPSPAWPSIAVGEAEATAIVNGYNGGLSGITAQAESDVAQLTRGTPDDPDEDSWTCMQRLASEVNWMIFSSPQPHADQWGNYLYYIDGVDAVAQRPSLYLELSDAGDVWSAIDPSTGKALTGNSDGMAFSITGTVDNTAFVIEQTAAASAASGASAGGKKISSTTRIRTPQTPSQMMFNLIAGVMEFNAGDVFVVRNAGPLDGRWIVEDVTHNTLGDLFAQFTLGPPVYAYPEPQANTVVLTGTNGNKVNVSTKSGAAAFTSSGSSITTPTTVAGIDQGTLNGVAQAAQLALAEQVKSGRTLYHYFEQIGAARESGGGLFGSLHPRTMDCSKFATLCYQAAGLSDPNALNYDPIGNTATLIAHCNKISEGDARPGDLCFFGALVNGSYQPAHVNVYIGNGQSISMGIQGDPSQGPSAQMGPAGFLGWFRSNIATSETATSSTTTPAAVDPNASDPLSTSIVAPGIFKSIFNK
jgi:cell wall-associated NlpC family hydrolase